MLISPIISYTVRIIIDIVVTALRYRTFKHQELRMQPYMSVLILIYYVVYVLQSTQQMQFNIIIDHC
jgi:uncharacterized membrane protein (DUF485 family)